MRKIFLATTALVAVTGVASADSHADIAITGSSSFNYVMTGDEDNSKDMDTQVDVNINMSHALENGMTVSGLYVMDEGIKDGPDDHGFSLGGDFGTIGFAGMSNDGFGATSNGVTKDEGSTFDSVTVKGPGDKDIPVYVIDEVYDDYIPHSDVSFKSVNISGFQFGLGMTDGATDDDDGSQFGMTYAMDVNDSMSVTLGYAKHSSGKSGGDISSTGATLGFGDMTVKLASNVTAKEGVEYTGNSIAATYAVSDALTVQAYTGNIDNDAAADYKVEDTAFGLTYTITPGMTVSVTHNEYTADNTVADQDADGSRTAIALDVTF